MRQLNVQGLRSAAPGVSSQGAAIPAMNLFAGSIQIITAGTAIAGNVLLQGSNDCANDETQKSNYAPTNWTDIPNSTVAITNNASFIGAKVDLCYEWVRVSFVSSAGGATGSVIVRFKALGA